MKTMKHGTARLVSMLLTLTMVLGLLPASAFAAETPAQTVTVQVNFDYRAVGSESMLTELDIAVPQNAAVEVPAGSTVYEALEAARAGGAFKPAYAPGFNNTPNGYITAFNDIGDAKDLYERMGAEDSQNLPGVSGWLYTINGVDGMGIQDDKLTEDATINFRYSAYSYWDDTSNTMVYTDWAFVDAYDGLKADLAAAETLDQTAYTEAEWAGVTAAVTAGQETLTAIDPDGLAASGLMLNYIAGKGTAIWGPGSPTDLLEHARKDLSAAVNKQIVPEKIVLPEDLVLTLGHSLRLTPVVLPEGAPQEVTFEVILGGDDFTVSETGLITPAKENSMCMIRVASAQDPNVFAMLKFKIEAYQPAVNEQAETLLHNLAAASVDAADEWTVMDMGAYQLTYPDGAKLTEAARQEYVNYAVKSMTTGNVDEGKVFKAILALRSQGADPARLTPYGMEGQVNAYELLTGMELGDSAWKAPYSLEAFHAADPTHELYKEKAQPLLEALLKNQDENGTWNEWGTIDTTANTIAALALYPEVEGVPAAIEKGLNYLSSIQDENGAFGKEPGVSWGTANSNSSALVVVALAAAGVDLAHDSRFIKNGHNAVDGLMSFALANGSGFGYTDNQTLNAFSTEQAFRALIPAVKALETGMACNVYDFSTAPAQPAAANGRSERVDVDFEGDRQQMTIEDVSEKLLPVVDGQVVRKSIHAEGNLLLVLDQDCTVELQLLPAPAFEDVKAEDWYFGAVGFGAVRQLFAGVGENRFAPEENLTRAQAVTMLRNLEEGEAKAEAPFTDLTQDWYKAPVAWAAETGVAAGVGEGRFAPDANVTRQELAQMMYNYAKSQGMDVSVKGGLKNFKDAGETASWAVEAMTWAVENGIMSGDGQGHLLPSATATRAQTAAMLKNLTTMLVLETVA